MWKSWWKKRRISRAPVGFVADVDVADEDVLEEVDRIAALEGDAQTPSWRAWTSVTIVSAPYRRSGAQSRPIQLNCPSTQTPSLNAWPFAWFSCPTCG